MVAEIKTIVNCLNKCKTNNVIYQCDVLINDCKKSYIGAMKNEMMLQFNSHQSIFRNKSKANSTGLSSYMEELNDKNINYTLEW